MLHCAVKITRPTALLKRKAKACGMCAGKVQNQTQFTHTLNLAMTRAVACDRLGSRIDALVTAKNKNFINVMIAVWFNTLIQCTQRHTNIQQKLKT